MKFIVTKKGENFIVSNDTTGQNRGVFKNKKEADMRATQLNKTQASGVKMASAKMAPADNTEDNDEDDGE